MATSVRVTQETEQRLDYMDTAKGQLRKLDKQTARRIIDTWMNALPDWTE